MRTVLVWWVLVAACAAPEGDSEQGGNRECPDVIAAEATLEADGTYTFSVTIRSPDLGWDKYADAWELVSPDGTVLGTRTLLHPHVDEQPFTRSLRGVVVPDGTTTLVVRAHDSVAGWCGDTLVVDLA